MLYFAYQTQSDIMAPMRAWASMALAAGAQPLFGDDLHRNLSAVYELISRAGLTHTRPPFGISHVAVGNREVEVREEPAARDAVRHAVAFQEGRARRPSRGFWWWRRSPATSRRCCAATVRTLLPEHDVFITDWHNARDVPITAGRFGIDEYVEHLIDYLEISGRARTCSRSASLALPVLAAVALMAQSGNPAQPRSMTLMAGPIDCRVNPTKVNELANKRESTGSSERSSRTVPMRYPGAFRHVYPGFVQLAAFMTMNVERHVKAHNDLYDNLANGELEKAATTKAFYDEYFAVLDLTAEFYLETVRHIFQEYALPRGRLKWRGETDRSRRDPAHRAADRRRRARRHLRGRPDRRRARPVQEASALSQAPPHAGRRRPLRRVLGQALGEPSLSDRQERDPVERLTLGGC